MQEKKGAYARAAARRLLSLKRRGENWSQFATRLGVSPQHITNYRKKGLSLDVLAGISPALSDAELIFVVGNRKEGERPVEPGVSLPPPAVLSGLREWLREVFPESTPRGAEGTQPDPQRSADEKAGHDLLSDVALKDREATKKRRRPKQRGSQGAR